MKFLLLISLRNLLRQKRRNLLLGAAIAIGMAVLVIANAFSHGISDVMFNRILTYVTGHVSVTFSVKGNLSSPVFRDGERMLDMARRALPDAKRVVEALGIFSRAVGNGVSDNIVLVGMDLRAEASERERAELRDNFRMEVGAFEDIVREDLENPVLLASEKAAYLKVKRGDVLRARFLDVFGRNQAVRLTVAGIFKPANIFMTAPVFMDQRRLKALAGYGPGDISSFQVTLSDPKRGAVPSGDSLHAALAPPLAAAAGRLTYGTRSAQATVLGFQVDTASLRALAAVLSLPAPRAVTGRQGAEADPGGSVPAPVPGSRFEPRAPGPKEIFAGGALADSLGLVPGAACTLAYRAKHASVPARAVFKVTGLIPESAGLPGNLLLVDDRDFYAFYYGAWPAPAPEAFRPDSGHALFPLVNREWVLMERTRTTEGMQRKYREATRLKTRATLVDVQTMYESASMIVKLEYALNLITLVAVLILFFIIQVGVVNTLRMTIKERTREIGTMRAIGMPRRDVHTLFMLETLFLSVAACAVGVALAFAGMAVLGRLTFDLEDNPMGMLLVNGHPHFLPTLGGTALYVALILAIAAVTAWFPARRAARLSPSDALRHFG
jgi:ABC-type lipoprotein release transport system permease subunit